MKHNTKNTCSVIVALTVAAFIISQADVLAYPPDNAAVLFYKTCLTYKHTEGDLAETVADVAACKVEPTDEVIHYIKEEVNTIKILAEAGRIEACDWGNDYREGFNLELPVLSNMRNLARIVLADAVIHIREKDWNMAIQRCETAYAMARHIRTDATLIHNLVGIALEALTNKVVTKTLAEMPVDRILLEKIERQLEQVATNNQTMRNCIELEKNVVVKYTSLEDMRKMFANSDASEEERSQLTEENFQKSKVYYELHLNRLMEAFSLAYPEGTAQINKLNEQINKDAETLPAAAMALTVIPAMEKCFSLEIRSRTDNNAMQVAIELYKIRANRGRLPRRLPPDLPKDLFSGKDFDYEITDEGFILRCKGEDIAKNLIHEYRFTVDK
ncbi:MAG: hypothetical protein JW828_08010 [Sedimentisphaerales bacterium]|nr:hypothetical protein [Sedimentisphaerales bacterium]